MVVPVNVPHPEIDLVGAGVSEIPQPPDIVSLSLVPLGLLLEILVTCLQLAPKKLRVVGLLLLSVAAKMPRTRSHSGTGPAPTALAVAGLTPASIVTKKFATVLSPLPEIVGELSTEQEQLPGTEQVPV